MCNLLDWESDVIEYDDRFVEALVKALLLRACPVGALMQAACL